MQGTRQLKAVKNFYRKKTEHYLSKEEEKTYLQEQPKMIPLKLEPALEGELQSVGTQ